MSLEKSPSAEAMDRYLSRSPGFGKVRRYKPMDIPSLPSLKERAQSLRNHGKNILDQSAGDIADVGAPMNSEFIEWLREFRYKFFDYVGNLVFPYDHNSIYGIRDAYKAKWPEVANVLAKSWGIQKTPFEFIQASSGRLVIESVMQGFLNRAKEIEPNKKPVLILDPMAWSGYIPLAKKNMEIIYSPVSEGNGLQMSTEGLEKSLEYAKEQDLFPAGIIPILPSNPTGVGMDKDDLKRFIEMAAGSNVPVMIDAFYSPLDPRGHNEAVPLGWLEDNLESDVFKYLGFLVGETKVVSSSNRTATAFWMSPEGQDDLAKLIMDNANKREKSLCAHAGPRALLTSAALHHLESKDVFPGGIHEMMGPRYEKLDAARNALRKKCDDLGLPLSIKGSFYGTVALVDSDGKPLIPVGSPNEFMSVLIDRYGLVGAPGSMFRTGGEAAPMLRLTAASTLDDIERLGKIFERILENAR